MNKKPVMLMILDGMGVTQPGDGNAVAAANKPNLDRLMAKYPVSKLDASGMQVGLPGGQMGNSEVGHLNIGTGRIIYQELTRITKAIADGDFFENAALLDAVKNAKENDKALHFMGLLSSGGVHSHIDHLKGLLQLAKRNEISKVYVHAFMDGRDVAPGSGKAFIEEIETAMKEIGTGEIASVSGRYYAMDRDNRWDRVELAYNAIVKGEGEKASSAIEAIEASYHDNKTDEFVLPTVIMNGEAPVGNVKAGDSVIFFNFRPDRARELTRAMVDVEFNGFERELVKTKFVCMTQYDATIANVEVAYKPESHTNTFGEVLAAKGLKQLRAAETEKYAHVTFFFNGGVETPNEGEDRLLVPSPKVATYDLQPEMNAPELTDKLIEQINANKYDVIIVNYANPDMVGHTGVMEAAVKAVEAVDTCVGRIADAILAHDGTLFITADHGNAEVMIDYSNGNPMTAHTTNLVPFYWISNQSEGKKLANGKLADIAPCMLEVLGVEKPAEMTGETLLNK
ncbi:MAG: 2,3-bisphosphoglycerate-independent phosphoglycerate mutase [Sarcina sp.]